MKWRDWRLALYLAVAGLVWCVAVGVVLYIAPFGTTETASDGVTSTGEAHTSAPVTTEGERLFEGSSLLELWPLVLPAVLCAVACLAAVRRHRWPLIVAMTLLALFSFISGFSIGLFYVPAVVLLVLSVLAASPVATPPRDGSSVAGR